MLRIVVYPMTRHSMAPNTTFITADHINYNFPGYGIISSFHNGIEHES